MIIEVGGGDHLMNFREFFQSKMGYPLNKPPMSMTHDQYLMGFTGLLADYIDDRFQSVVLAKTEIKSESKMDVNVGDRVLVEAVVIYATDTGAAIKMCSGDTANVPRSVIKSVEPASPGVGDIVSWDQERPLEIFGIRNNNVWREHSDNSEDATCERLAAMLRRPGFHIVKRAEPK